MAVTSYLATSQVLQVAQIELCPHARPHVNLYAAESCLKTLPCCVYSLSRFVHSWLHDMWYNVSMSNTQGGFLQFCQVPVC